MIFYKCLINFLTWIILIVPVVAHSNPALDFLCNNKFDVYAVVSGDQRSLIPELLKVDCLSGVTVLIGWRKLEPAKDVYDFDELISISDSVKKSGKKINIGLLTGRWVPDYLLENRTDVISWMHLDRYTEKAISPRRSYSLDASNHYYQQRFKVMLEKIAPIVNSNDSIGVIYITGGSNTNGIELNYIANINSDAALRFDYEGYIRNWRFFIDAYVATFPDKVLGLAVHNQYVSERSIIPSTKIVEYARAKRDVTVASFAFTTDHWFRSGNDYVDMLDELAAGKKIILQSLIDFSVKGDSCNIISMVSKAKNFNVSILELWGADIVNLSRNNSRCGYFAGW